MFAVQLAFPPVVVLNLVLQLCLVLQADQVHAQLLQRPELPVLQLLHGLVVTDQHGVFHLLLALLPVQLLEGRRDGGTRSQQWDRGTEGKQRDRLSNGGGSRGTEEGMEGTVVGQWGRGGSRETAGTWEVEAAAEGEQLQLLKNHFLSSLHTTSLLIGFFFWGGGFKHWRPKLLISLPNLLTARTDY